MDNRIVIIIITMLLGVAIGLGAGNVTFNPQVETLQSSLSAVADEQSSLDATMTNLKASLTTYQDALDDINSTLYGLSTDWTGLDYNALNTTLSNLMDLVSDMQNNVSDVQEGLVDLRNDLTVVNASINAIETRQWNVAYTVRQSSGPPGTWIQNSSIFQIQGKRMSINWKIQTTTTKRGFEHVMVRIGVYFANGTLYDEVGSASYMGEDLIFTDEMEMHSVLAGNYYLQMYVRSQIDDLDWTINVWDYY